MSESSKTRKKPARSPVIRRAGRFTSEDIHQQLFGAGKPKRRSVADLKAGIRTYVRERYPRG